jgi:hypothetical protein
VSKVLGVSFVDLNQYVININDDKHVQPVMENQVHESGKG